MKFIKGINILIGDDGLLPITRHAFIFACQYDLSVKLFLTHDFEDNLLNVLDLANEYYINDIELSFNNSILKTSSIYYDGKNKYDFDKDLNKIIDINRQNTFYEKKYIKKR